MNAVRRHDMPIGLRLTKGAVVAACLLVAFPGCGRDGGSVGSASAPIQEQRDIKPTNVDVSQAIPEKVDETFILPGTLEAWQDLTLSLEQSGPISWVGPREGDRVRAGEDILKIDTETLLNQYGKDQIEYNLKKKNLDRFESLLNEQLLSQREFDDARQVFEAAKANLAQSKIALEKSTLASPIDGILDSLLVDRGEYGTVGSPAAVVLQIDRLKVLVNVPEKDVPFIKKGQDVVVMPAEVNSSAGIGRKGRVIHVAYKADEMTRTYLTKIQIDNRDGSLRPGMILRVRFTRRTLEDVLTVPLYTVVDRKGEKFVFVVENAAAVKRKVRLGPIVDGRVVVYGGIQPGESVIVKGQQLLSDGGAVKVVGDSSLHQ